MDYKLTYYKRQDVEEFKKTVNQSAINNINEFMTNPISQMINIINENNLTISQYLAQNNVQSLAKALKLTNLDTLKVNFTSDINENVSYNPLTNEITLNTRNEGNYIPIIAHEMVGHAILGEVIQSDSGNAIYENIAKNILSEQELANIRNNYTELDESGFKEEVVSFGLQKIMNNTNNLSYKKFVRKFFPSSFKDKIMNSLDTIFRNNSDNRVLNEIRKTIRQLLNANTSDVNDFDLAMKYEKDIENLEENNNNNLYERTDEFRRLQEESRSKSFESIRQQGTYATSDEGLRQRLSRVLREELERGGINSSNFELLHLTSNKNTKFNIYKNVNPNIFHDVFELVRKYIPNGELVDLHENYNNIECYISDDGLSGFAIERNGNLVSVFNANNMRGFLDAISNIIRNNTSHLDCFVSPNQDLQEMYQKKFGFKTASIKDYNMEFDHDNIAQNHNMPQVAFMVNTAEDVETRHFNKDQYDEAQAYQLSFVKDDTTKYSKSNVLEPSKNEVKDLANRKQGEVISYKSASDFIKSFNSIGEVLENRFNIELNRNDTAINELFNDTNIQNSEVAVENLFKNTLVDYDDTQISLDTYLKNLGFKTNDLKII